MKKILFVILFVNTIIYISAQNEIQPWTEQKPNVILSSPQSQIFEKYLKHEITEYNGLPEISIPLYEIEIKGLKIPVTLNYHASGIKYKQFDGDIGAGWSLNIGGYRVTRTINGAPDETFGRVSTDIYNDYLSLIASGRMTQQQMDLDFFVGIAGDPTQINKDSEYDQFNYMLPATSGHFILDDNRTARTYETNQDIIKLGGIIKDQGYSDMTIIDNSGFKYILGGNGIIEKSVHKIGEYEYRYTTAWPLREIISQYNDKIEFSYSSHKKTIYPNENSFANAALMWAPCRFEGGESTLTSFHLDSVRTMPRSINYYDYEDMLFLDELNINNTDLIRINRGPIEGKYTYSIKSIEIKVNGIDLKKISFEYLPPNSRSWHFLLAKVKIQDINNNTLNEYAFDYYPGKTGLPDQYNFYGTENFAHNGFQRINIYLHEQFLKDEFIENSFLQNSKRVQEILSINHFIKWYNRKPTNIPNSYMLKKITFPTKGYTEYEYGTHNVYGGIYVKKIISQAEVGTIPVITEYNYLETLPAVDVITHEHFADEYISPVYIQGAGWNGRYDYRKVVSYNSNPIYPELSDYFVQHKRIEKKQYDAEMRTIGKTISEYNLPKKYIYTTFDSNKSRIINSFSSEPAIFHQTKYGTLFTSKYRLGYKPTLKSRKYYNNKNVLLKDEVLLYEKRNVQTHTGFKVKKKFHFSQGYQSCSSLDCYIHSRVNSMFLHDLYYIETGSDFLTSKETTIYTDSGNPLKEEEFYTYDKYHQITSTKRIDSGGRMLTKDYTYTWVYHPIWESLNIISVVAQTVTFSQGASESKEIEILKTCYPLELTTQANLLYPDSVVSIINGVARTYIKYDKHDAKGKVLQYTGLDGVTVTYLWGYGNKYPVAEIQNATYANIQDALGGQSVIQRINSNLILSQGDKSILDNLRNTLPEAMITTYTYQLGVGILTVTNPTGLTTTYEYDSFGRLIAIRNHEGEVIEDYLYHYKGQ